MKKLKQKATPKLFNDGVFRVVIFHTQQPTGMVNSKRRICPPPAPQDGDYRIGRMT